MTRRTLALAVVSLAGLLTLAATVLYAQDAEDDVAAPTPTVRAVGMTIAVHDGSDSKTSSLAQGVDAGTSLHLLADFGDLTAIEIIRGACTLEAFTDDLGTVLLEPEEAAESRLLGIDNERIADDGHSAQFSFTARRRPVAGASGLVLKVKLAVLIGHNRTTAVFDNVSLTPGETFLLGDHAIEIREVAAPGWDDTQLEVKFASDESFSDVAAMRFLDADGKDIDSYYYSRGRIGMGDYTSYRRSMVLGSNVEVTAIEIDYFAKTETVNVPVDMTVGLGL